MADVMDILATKEGMIIFYASIMIGVFLGFSLGWYHRGREKQYAVKWWLLTGVVILLIVLIRLWFLFQS
jgi:hypothetical protein